MTVTGRGPTDEAVVAVKLEAYENTVTYLRIKLPASDRKLEAKGGTCDQVSTPIKNYHHEFSQMGHSLGR